MQKKRFNATFVAFFLFQVIFMPMLLYHENVFAEEETYTHQFTEVRNPGFWIWEDPNTPNYYAYATSMLTGELERFHFHKDRYGVEGAFVRIGHEKPKKDPNTGAEFDPANLRLIEVRPYNHDAFYPSDVQIEQNETRVLINIDGIDFTRTPFVEYYNEFNKGTWTYGNHIYSENHHIPLELVWEYTDTMVPDVVDCPPSGVQTSVTKESGRIYYSCNCDDDGCDVCVRIYYETVEMDVLPPSPEVVKAGNGTEIIVKTYYTNDYPYHIGRPYAPSNVYFTGENTDNYPSILVQQVNMLTDEEDPAKTWNRNVTWKLPYAKIEEDGTWTMTASKEEVDKFLEASPFHYGGLQRWYVGFDVPDGEVIEFAIQTNPSGYNKITLCDKVQVSVDGSVFDDFIIRAVDPNNPFPTGTGLNWQGHEDLIYNLTDWYNEHQLSRPYIEEKVQNYKNTIFHRVKDFFSPD